MRQENTYLAQHYLQSPYFFMCCSLYDATEDRPAPYPPSQALAGTLVSSLYRLKDVDNVDGGFFIFGDLSIKVEGEFRLKFTLFEMQKDVVRNLKSVISNTFVVLPPKAFPGMAESTFMSRSFADQGVKLRIRKEARNMMKRGGGVRPDDYTNVPRSPERTTMPPIANPAFAGYAPPTGRDYSTFYGSTAAPAPAAPMPPATKRIRTSIDMGNRGPGPVFDGDAQRFPQAYPQTTSLYPNPNAAPNPAPNPNPSPNPSQTPGYQNPPMPTFPAYGTGQTGNLPDYNMRQMLWR